jgi:hypothetical protein
MVPVRRPDDGDMSALDVLLVESHAGVGHRHAESLAAAGHRVHRCGSRGAEAFPCTEITNPGSCPIDQGVDVALLVRRNVALRPTDREQAVSCAIRSAIPIVEDGPTVLDPYDDYVTSRVTGDLVEACEDAAERGYDELRSTIRDRCAAVLAAVGADPEMHFRRHGRRLSVEIHGEAITPALRDTLAVRVVSAVNDATRDYEGVDVTYQENT